MIMTTGKVMGGCGGRKERQNREKDNGNNHTRLDRQEKYESRCCAGRRCQKLRVKRVDPNRTESVKLRSDTDWDSLTGRRICIYHCNPILRPINRCTEGPRAMASLSHGYPAFQRNSLARAESDESTLPQLGSPVGSGSAEATQELCRPLPGL